MSIVATYTYAIFFHSSRLFLYLVIIILSVITVEFAGELYSMIILLITLTIMAFFNLAIAFKYPSFLHQVSVIGEQLLGASLMVSWWLFFILTYRESARRHYYEQLLQQLNKIDPISELLTPSEFFDNLFYLIRNMVRKNETAFGIIITVDSPDMEIPSSIRKILGNIIKSSVRIGYDLMGDFQTHMAIALNNTNEKGAEIVKNRIIDKLSRTRYGKGLIPKLNFSTFPLSTNYEENKKLFGNPGGIKQSA